MKNGDKTSFWADGGIAFMERLCREEKEAICALKKTLKSENDPEKTEELKRQIKNIRSQFRKKKKDADYSLF